jgi:DNA-binding response OmpR family regulator
MAAAAPVPPAIVLAGAPSIRELLADLLREEGYDVVTAADESAAFALARAGPPGLIVLDLDLRSPDGGAFCRAYREHGGTAPIVLITDAAVGPGTVARYGADAYIAKPFDLDVVLATVARLVGGLDGRA